ncbi:hypothetical protein [Pseudomonas bohemica]|uniref:hypothetical protein n=1 Tax=Pseudomonas bohemica TaxID=2044872 RepID=UPI0018FE8034|nr:hypothetical protein [Pseudomonas bohemica]
MSSLAEQALEHARQRLAGQATKRPTSRVAKINIPTPAPPRSLEVVVDGPINHFMFLEGRAWAIDMVKSLRASPLKVVIERLAGAAQNRPGSYAAGIDSVIKELGGEQQ